MKRLIVFGVTLAALVAVRPVSAQYINPRQGGSVIGNNSQGVISVQAPTETPVEQPVETKPVETKPVATKPDISKPAQASSQYVIVTGQVANPGVYEFRNGIASLEELIDQAGGLTQFSSREFYVYRHPKGFLELDFRTQANFPFENGDILIAETPVRYYRELNNHDSKIRLSDLHGKTQIIMFNLADRPVLFTVPPSGARMPALLELLRQNPTAMVGSELKQPPHAREIPSHAQLAPNLVPSSSIIFFDPKRIDRSTLPALPPAIIASPSRSQQAVSQNTPAPKPESQRMRPSGLFEWKQISSDAPLTEFKPSQAVANGSLLGSKEPPPADDLLLIEQPERAEAPKITTATHRKSVPTEAAPPKAMIFSPQQKAIVIGFCVVISLFVIAYVVRKKQEQRELLPLAADTAKHTNAIISLYSKLLKLFSRQTAENSKLDQLEAASETVASVAEAASSVAEMASETHEAEPAITQDSEPSAKSINPDVENRLVQFVNRIAASSTESDRSLVELLIELAASQENQVAESAESPTQQAEIPAPASNVAATTETHSGTQPMFPMIWEQKLEQSGEHANAEIPEAPELRTEKTPHSDHPIANSPHRIPLDRVFFAVQKERNHKETNEQ